MSDDEADGWAVGALLGFIFGGPVGGFVGAILGAAADEACGSAPKAMGSNAPSAQPQAETTRPHAYHSSNNTGHHGGSHQDPVLYMPTLETALNNAFEALGLRPGVTLDGVKRRYHELARRYHPDLYEAAGTDPRLRVEAQQYFLKIRDAYELINQHLAGRR